MLLLTTTVAIAQNEGMVLQGYVEEGTVKALQSQHIRDRFYTLEQVEVVALRNGLVTKRMTTDSTGFFRLNLDPAGVYEITFSKQGYLDKIVIMDGSKFPNVSKGAIMLDSDIALFRDLGHEKLREYAQLPFAKCKYYKSRKEFRWDDMYSVSAREHFYDLLEEATIASLGGKD
jgi:hypothetical protein